MSFNDLVSNIANFDLKQGETVSETAVNEVTEITFADFEHNQQSIKADLIASQVKHIDDIIKHMAKQTDIVSFRIKTVTKVISVVK